MKKSLLRILVGLVIAGGVLTWNPSTKSKPAAVLAETNGCRLPSLNGTYGFSFTGYFGSSSPYIPVAAAGTFTFRPDGTVLRRANGSFGGGLFTVNDSGTYVLNEDCSFSARVNPNTNETEMWNLIPVDEGRQLEFFVNTPLRTAAGTMTRQ